LVAVLEEATSEMTATIEFSSEAIRAMETRRRAAFINCLSGFKAANLVGTADAEGHTNLAIMSSAVHLGADPPLLALVIRPGGEERHTLSNILGTGCYSLNHIHSAMVEAAHQTAARYDRALSEFDATGLTPRWHPGFAAPLVQEASISLGLELREHQQLAINRTHLVIGEIVLARLPADALFDDGAVDLAAAGTVAISGLDHYYAPVSLQRMAYAKPHLPPRRLNCQLCPQHTTPDHPSR
jgi:flavin reductase (DIM6/NTAB) family NADH-FMN oxidoreductase RutF